MHSCSSGAALLPTAQDRLPGKDPAPSAPSSLIHAMGGGGQMAGEAAWGLSDLHGQLQEQRGPFPQGPPLWGFPFTKRSLRDATSSSWKQLVGP